jgi:hypothetical protein
MGKIIAIYGGWSNLRIKPKLDYYTWGDPQIPQYRFTVEFFGFFMEIIISN